MQEGGEAGGGRLGVAGGRAGAAPRGDISLTQTLLDQVTVFRAAAGPGPSGRPAWHPVTVFHQVKVFRAAAGTVEQHAEFVGD